MTLGALRVSMLSASAPWENRTDRGDDDKSTLIAGHGEARVEAIF